MVLCCRRQFNHMELWNRQSKIPIWDEPPYRSATSWPTNCIQERAEARATRKSSGASLRRLTESETVEMGLQALSRGVRRGLSAESRMMYFCGSAGSPIGNRVHQSAPVATAAHDDYAARPNFVYKHLPFSILARAGSPRFHTTGTSK